MKIIKVNINDVNLRLDNFLSKTFINFKKSEIYKAIRNKKVKVNNKKAKFNYHVKLNDEIKLFVNDELLENKKQQLNLENKQDFSIVYEDANIMLVYKPKGLVVHTDNNGEVNTLINQVINYLIRTNRYDPKLENTFVPSLVNRLDRNTAGIVLIAKNRPTLDLLNEKMKNHEINKYYIAKVHGIIDPKSATLIAYSTKNSNDNLVKITKKPINNNSKQITTKYKMISHDANTSVIEINLLTGRTHQIRAHMNYIGFPLVGERKYTNSKFSNQTKNKQQSLCAYKIEFNFTTNSKHLAYLNKKSFRLDNKTININL